MPVQRNQESLRVTLGPILVKSLPCGGCNTNLGCIKMHSQPVCMRQLYLITACKWQNSSFKYSTTSPRIKETCFPLLKELWLWKRFTVLLFGANKIYCMTTASGEGFRFQLSKKQSNAMSETLFFWRLSSWSRREFKSSLTACDRKSTTENALGWFSSSKGTICLWRIWGRTRLALRGWSPGDQDQDVP